MNPWVVGYTPSYLGGSDPERERSDERRRCRTGSRRGGIRQRRPEERIGTQAWCRFIYNIVDKLRRTIFSLTLLAQNVRT